MWKIKKAQKNTPILRNHFSKIKKERTKRSRYIYIQVVKKASGKSKRTKDSFE